MFAAFLSFLFNFKLSLSAWVVKSKDYQLWNTPATIKKIHVSALYTKRSLKKLMMGIKATVQDLIPSLKNYIKVKV